MYKSYKDMYISYLKMKVATGKQRKWKRVRGKRGDGRQRRQDNGQEGKE